MRSHVAEGDVLSSSRSLSNAPREEEKRCLHVDAPKEIVD